MTLAFERDVKDPTLTLKKGVQSSEVGYRKTTKM